MNDEPKILIPYDRVEACTVKIAARIAGVSERTVQNWAMQHQIGRRIAGGPWRISRPALQMLLDGDKGALREYLKGERGGRVAKYFERARQLQQSPQNPHARCSQSP
jgi:hypothetical protein